jgi:hypothetical protein
VSSITGSPTDTTDATLQLAPAGEDGPDFGELQKAFQSCISNNEPFVEQCRQNYQTRYALWDGQSADGKKHSRGGSKIDPTPWDGASDLRVFLTDDAINAKVAMECMAFRAAQVVATPIEGSDIERAKIVSGFMRWLVQTQIPEIDRETELLAQYLNEKGVAATGQFWEKCQEKTLAKVTMQDLARQFDGVDVQRMLDSGTFDDDLSALFEEVFGCTKRKAKKMLAELRSSGETSVPVVGREYSRPIIRAFSLDENLFIPAWATDIEHSPAIYRIEYFTPEQLRGFVRTDGWDEAWVENAIESQRGKWLTATPPEILYPISRSFIWQEQRFHDLIGVVYAYQRLSDEDGIPGIYLTVFNPNMPPDSTTNPHDGYAKFGLLGYAHGQYPFVLHRREYLSRRLHDSRGIPEPGKPWQDSIKAHKDSRIDAASMAILPPLMYPIGRPPARWGAGARVPERRSGEYHFADRPAPDMNTDESERLLRDDFREYVGFSAPGGDVTFAAWKNKFDVDKFLRCWAKAYRQVWKLYQQFGSDEVYFRVIGLKKAEPSLMTKGDPREDFDVAITFDVDTMNPEIWEKKLEAIAKIATTTDREGTVDWAQLTQVLLESVDVNIAERILQPKETSQIKFMQEEKGALSNIFAGFEEDIKIGSPAQLGLQIISQYVQTPDVAQRLQSDEAFRKRLEKRAKQYQFQITQQENARIGQLGA